MDFNRRAVFLGLVAAAFFAAPEDAHARKSRRRRIRARGASGGGGVRGATSDGNCPCNGGKVCIGPRGGRFCITSGGNKRYGV